VLMRTGQTLSRLRLAVLSACETGVPDPKALNESLGLPAGFLLAGVPGVVGSLWLVADDTTALLVAFFYDKMCKKRVDAAEALRRAQVWMLKKSPEEKERYLSEFSEKLRSESLVGTRMLGEVAEELAAAVGIKGDRYSEPHYWAAFGYFGVPVKFEEEAKRQ